MLLHGFRPLPGIERSPSTEREHGSRGSDKVSVPFRGLSVLRAKSERWAHLSLHKVSVPFRGLSVLRVEYAGLLAPILVEFPSPSGD